MYYFCGLVGLAEGLNWHTKIILKEVIVNFCLKYFMGT